MRKPLDAPIRYPPFSNKFLHLFIISVNNIREITLRLGDKLQTTRYIDTETIYRIDDILHFRYREVWSGRKII